MIQPTSTTYELVFDEETPAVSVELSCDEEITIERIFFDSGDGQYVPLCQAVEYDDVTVVLPIALAQGVHSLSFVGAAFSGFGFAIEGSNIDTITDLGLSNMPRIRKRIPLPIELILPSIHFLDDETWFWDDEHVFLDEDDATPSIYFLDDETWFWDDEGIYLDQ